jgi:hypothetical protein
MERPDVCCRLSLHLVAGYGGTVRQGWAEVTRPDIEEGRSYGSVLGKAQDGSWMAVARWQSKQQRDD